ncbi:MAG: peptidoglycan-binding protein [Microthrixaceae bacterium]|nr:peptidoglycan-binding protein [Microthrixaceae bacterium]
MSPRPMSTDTSLTGAELTDRLQRLGMLPTTGTPDDAVLRDGIAAFQRSRGLDVTGEVDPVTLGALDEATYSFGDRPLYLTSPMLRGEDVSWLQLRLGSLGFDAGRVDGIFGPNTQQALCEFQRNVDLVVDGVCARDTVAQLNRLSSRMGNLSVAGLRERESLSRRTTDLSGLHIAVVALGDDPQLTGAIASSLSDSSASVSVQTAHDWSDLAAYTNNVRADVCIAIELVYESVLDLAYFGTDGFESHAGRALAETLLRQLPQNPAWGPCVAQAMRLPILRETRCPTVRLRLGPSEDVTEQSSLLVAAVGRSLRLWVSRDHD